jgi:hypothetical protein
MKKWNLFSIAIILLIASSCAKVYHSPEAEKAIASHKIIAVLPPSVTIPPQKKISNDELQTMMNQESEIFQYEMVSWLLKRKSQNKINVDILDASTTLAKVSNSSNSDRMLTPNEYTELLDVDAVLTSKYKLTKPMSAGAAIATTILFGFGTTNEITVSMELHDRKTKKMIWNFSHSMSGGLFSTSDQLVGEVMRIASKKLPYTKFKN